MKLTIRFKLFTLSIFLILFTSIAITIPYYFLTLKDKHNSSQIRLSIAFSIIRDDLQNQIENNTSQITDFIQQVSAIPWELSWYKRTENKTEFFSDPTYSSYIITIGDEFRRFSRFVMADRIALYGKDKRLLVTYMRNGEIDMTGAYIVNQDGKDSFLSTHDYSRYLITRQRLPELPLTQEMPSRLEGEIPDNVISEPFSDGKRFGLKMTVPVFHQGLPVGAITIEIPYTQQLIDRFAQLSRTEVNFDSIRGVKIQTLPLQQSFDGLAPLEEFDENNIILTPLTANNRDYYRGSFSLLNSRGEEVGVVSAFLSRTIERQEILRMLRAIFLIDILTILVAFAITVIFSRNTLKFIRDLTAATSSIADGILRTPIPHKGNDEHGQLASSVTIMRDALVHQITQLKSEIDEHKKTSQELEASRKRLSTIFSSIGDGIITCGNEGQIQRLNNAAEVLLGWNNSEAIDQKIEELLHIHDPRTEEPIKNPVPQVLEDPAYQPAPLTALLTNREGREYRVSISLRAISDMKGVVSGAVLIIHDITEEYAMQNQFRQNQKMDSIGQLAGGVAHDFNNMLGGILGAAEMVSTLSGGNAKVLEFVGLIQEAAGRASDLAAKLLAFSRRQTTGSTPINIHKTIEDTVSLLRNTVDKRIHIDKDGLKAPECTILGDDAQLQSVFLNLGINASHAMPDGGTLTFSSRCVELSKEDCQAYPYVLTPGRFLEVKVKDTGCGIPKENLPRIFEPFFTTKDQGKGTGLGLAATYGTIRQYSGAISVYSEEGQGTSFQLLFPLSKASEKRPDKGLDVIHGEGFILFVDDEKVIRMTGKALLSNMGYDIIVAEDGIEAVELFKEKAREIDLVILDMTMPGLNGRECFFQLKKIRPDIKVILASGFLNNDDLAELKENGLSDFIHKPYKKAELSRVVSKALSSP